MPSEAAIVALGGLLALNIGGMVAGYLSLRDARVRHEVMIETLRRDVNALGRMIRERG